MTAPTTPNPRRNTVLPKSPSGVPRTSARGPGSSSPRPSGGSVSRAKTLIPYGSAAFRILWTGGVPITRIAELCGVKPPAVSKGARLAGLPRRGPGRPRRSVYDSETFRALWLGDVKVEAIAAQIGVSPCTVWNAAMLRGLPPKHHMRAAR